MSAIGGTFYASAEAMTGISAKQLRIVGSVVRWAAGPRKGKIHSYLQETGLVGGILQSMQGAGATAFKSTLATGIGVSLVGFGIMTARLSQIESRLASLADGTDRILAAIERIRQDQLAAEFASLRSQIHLFEEAWLMTDRPRAAQVWLDVAQAARPHQDRFEDRARELLLAMPPEFALADPMVDALSLAGGLRVACLMACDESAAASVAASENARQIESLTGGIGKADLVLARMPAGIDRASQEWESALATAESEAAPIAANWRQREAVAATRAAPLAQLEKSGMRPREWLAAARAEREEPLLLLKAS